MTDPAAPERPAPRHMTQRQRFAARYAISQIDATPAEKRALEAIHDHLIPGHPCRPSDAWITALCNLRDPRILPSARKKAEAAGVLTVEREGGRPNGACTYVWHLPDELPAAALA